MNKRKDRVLDSLDAFLIILFFLSWLNSLTVLLFYLSLLFLLFRKSAGCMKGLILLTTRGLINPAAAVSVSRFELLKWALLFLFSLYILCFSKAEGEDRRKLTRILVGIAAFSLSTAGFSFIVSSYPVTAVFKTAAFSIPMCAVFLGVAVDRTREDGIDYLACLYGILFLISICLIPFRRFRTVNADFQGIFNHVNVFGAVASLYTAAALKSCYFSRCRMVRNLLITMIIIMTYLSRSRSGMFTILCVLGLKYLFSSAPALRKFLVGICGTAGLLLIFLLMPNDVSTDITGLAHTFIYKGDTRSIWAHRLSQIEEGRTKFMAHFLTGSGFMVPYDPRIRDYSFTFRLVVEPGNIIWAVLGDTGILGSLLFLYVLFCIGSSGRPRDLYLLGGALAVNMGEMVFFSPNNYAILIYLLLAVYAFGSREEGKTNEPELYCPGL